LEGNAIVSPVICIALISFSAN